MNPWGRMPDQTLMQQVSYASYPQMADPYGIRGYGNNLYNGTYGLIGGPVNGNLFSQPTVSQAGGNYGINSPMMNGFNFMNMGALGNNLFGSLEVQLGMLAALLLGITYALKGEEFSPQNDFTGIIDPFTGMPMPAPYSKDEPAKTPLGGTKPAVPEKSKLEKQKGNEAPAAEPRKPEFEQKLPSINKPVVPAIPSDILTDERIINMTKSNGLGGFDTVVKGLFGTDAFIIDMTGQFEGQLDRNDIIKFKDPDTGQWMVRFVGEDIYDIQSRAATIDASKDMTARMKQGNVSFQEDMDLQKFNPQYWEETKINGHTYWQVKPGIKPSDAVSDVFNGNVKGAYSLDCAASINLVLLKAKLDTIGAEDFNREYNGLTMRGWDKWMQNPVTGQWINDENGSLDWVSGNHNNNSGKPENLKPGDFAYFRNLDIPEGSSADQGENAIFLGYDELNRPMFFGNPIGIIYDTKCKYGVLSEMKGGLSPNVIGRQDRNVQMSYTPPK
jgi:hypothetical protein